MSLPSESFSAAASPEYTLEERKALLNIAHESILSFLQGVEIPSVASSAHLNEPRGVFSTIYSEGKLRGCVGYPTAIVPLYRAVIETARAAAFDDPRFPPVKLEEARQLRVSLSVLSPLRPISVDEIKIGCHGLVVSAHGQRGLLLPQVPVEHGWDRTAFLEQTCRKAGLPSDAWRRGAQIEAFTAEVFADGECVEKA
jgi:AmmeMemoRadiSam system protein A